MARTFPFLMGSLGAHVIALATLWALVSQGGLPPPRRVVRVSAVQRPEPTPEPAPEVEPDPVIAPEPEPPRRPRRSARRPEPSPPPPPEPRVEPQRAERPEPSPSVTPEPSPVSAAAPEPRDSHPVVAASGPPGERGGEAGPSASRGDDGGEVDGSGRGRRRGGARTAELCQAATSAFVRRMEATATYPSWARGLGLEGRLQLSLRVGRDGRPRGVRVVRTSGHPGFDRHALAAARAIAGLPSGCPRPFSVGVTLRPRR